MLYYKDLEKRISKGLLKHSSVEETDILQKILKEIGISNNTIEIGTYYGVSTIVLASWAKEVTTFDIIHYPEFDTVKNMLKELKNILSIVAYDRVEIETLLSHMNKEFDFAFIDAYHDYSNVKADFRIVKKYGRVLFHDADNPGIKQFIEEIQGKIFPYKDNFGRQFGYWEKGI